MILQLIHFISAEKNDRSFIHVHILHTLLLILRKKIERTQYHFEKD